MLENKRPFSWEQYNIYIDAWKQKTLCVTLVTSDVTHFRHSSAKTFLVVSIIHYSRRLAMNIWIISAQERATKSLTNIKWVACVEVQVNKNIHTFSFWPVTQNRCRCLNLQHLALSLVWIDWTVNWLGWYMTEGINAPVSAQKRVWSWL